MKRVKLLFVFVLTLLSYSAITAETLTLVAVGEAGLAVEKVQFYHQGLSSKGQVLLDVMVNDFNFYRRYFNTTKTGQKMDTSSFPKDVSLGVELTESSGRYRLRAYSKGRDEMLVDEQGPLTSNNLRGLAHELADQVYRAHTGKDSVFKTKITFVSDRTGTRKNPVKELYIMDFDGGNKTQLTRHGGTVIGPAISPDGSKILYSLIRENVGKSRNVNLMVYDMSTRQSQLVSNRAGLNSGAVFLPGGEDIILTLSHSGNAELYEMNLKSKNLKRLTRDGAPDVDPSINVDGTLLTFLSARHGKPMIFTLDPSGLERNVKQISFVGQFNATPRFSPDGKEIVFSSWLDNRFDLFRINAKGTGLSRLTKDFGSNEDPTFSNDGEFIAFTSQRVMSATKAVKKIYIMDRYGEILGSITDDYGNCMTPRWSKLPN